MNLVAVLTELGDLDQADRHAPSKHPELLAAHQDWLAALRASAKAKQDAADALKRYIEVANRLVAHHGRVS